MAGGAARLDQAQVSVPRRGFVVFLRVYVEYLSGQSFQVSVPRRGFVVFLLILITDQLAEAKGAHVSVPRRGFVVFLPVALGFGALAWDWWFQSPEGDSLFFY